MGPEDRSWRVDQANEGHRGKAGVPGERCAFPPSGVPVGPGPSPHVAEALERSHRTWLSTPGKKGQEHKDSQIRRLLPDYSRQLGATGHPYGKGWLNPYRDAWQLLKLEAAEPEATDAEQNDDDAAA